MKDLGSPSDLRSRSRREPGRLLALREARAFCAYTSFAEGALLVDAEAALGFVEEWGSDEDRVRIAARVAALRGEVTRSLVAALDVVGERPDLREPLSRPRLTAFLVPWLASLRERTDERVAGDPALERGRAFGLAWGDAYHALELEALVTYVCGVGERGPVMRRLEQDALARIETASDRLAAIEADDRFRDALRDRAAGLLSGFARLSGLEDPTLGDRERLAGVVRAVMFDPTLWRDDGPRFRFSPAAGRALADLLAAHRIRADLAPFRAALADALAPDEPVIAGLLRHHAPATDAALLGGTLPPHRGSIVPGLGRDLTGALPIADLRAFTAPIASRVKRFTLSRGLVSEVTMTGAAVVAHADALAALAPIEALTVLDRGDEAVAALVRSPLLRGLRRLSLPPTDVRALGDHDLVITESVRVG